MRTITAALIVAALTLFTLPQNSNAQVSTKTDSLRVGLLKLDTQTLIDTMHTIAVVVAQEYDLNGQQRTLYAAAHIMLLDRFRSRQAKDAYVAYNEYLRRYHPLTARAFDVYCRRLLAIR